MQRTWVVGLAMTLLGGCGKHETSAPHVTLDMQLQGENTREIASERFDDGWSVRFERFRLAATFGVDDIIDPVKEDGPRYSGADVYVYGIGPFDLTDAAPVSVFGAWTLAGHSTGWGMRLRQSPVAPTEPEAAAPLVVTGEATGPEGEVVKFFWRFSNEITFAHCVEPGETLLPLPEGSETLLVTLDGAALFRAHGVPGAKLGFARLASADVDGDGVVTTEELGAESLLESEQAAEDSAATNLYELLSERLTGLVAADFECQVAAPVLDPLRGEAEGR